MSNMKKRLAQTLANYSCSKKYWTWYNFAEQETIERSNTGKKPWENRPTNLEILEPFRWWFMKQTLIPLCAKAKEERDCSCRQMPITQSRRDHVHANVGRVNHDKVVLSAFPGPPKTLRFKVDCKRLHGVWLRGPGVESPAVPVKKCGFFVTFNSH